MKRKKRAHGPLSKHVKGLLRLFAWKVGLRDRKALHGLVVTFRYPRVGSYDSGFSLTKSIVPQEAALAKELGADVGETFVGGINRCVMVPVLICCRV